MFSKSLNFSEVTAYEQIGRGIQVVTIMGENGYIFVQKQVEFRDDEYVTIAIINYYIAIIRFEFRSSLTEINTVALISK